MAFKNLGGELHPHRCFWFVTLNLVWACQWFTLYLEGWMQKGFYWLHYSTALRTLSLSPLKAVFSNFPESVTIPWTVIYTLWQNVTYIPLFYVLLTHISCAKCFWLSWILNTNMLTSWSMFNVLWTAILMSLMQTIIETDINRSSVSHGANRQPNEANNIIIIVCYIS